MTYLDFVERADYIAHLKEMAGGAMREAFERSLKTNLELTGDVGQPGQFGNRAVSYYAVATQAFDNYIAVWNVLLMQTDTFSLDFDKQREAKDGDEHQTIMQKVHARFAEVRKEFEDEGFDVMRGRWRNEAPAHLTQ